MTRLYRSIAEWNLIDEYDWRHEIALQKRILNSIQMDLDAVLVEFKIKFSGWIEFQFGNDGSSQLEIKFACEIFAETFFLCVRSIFGFIFLLILWFEPSIWVEFRSESCNLCLHSGNRVRCWTLLVAFHWALKALDPNCNPSSLCVHFPQLGCCSWALQPRPNQAFTNTPPTLTLHPSHNLD